MLLDITYVEYNTKQAVFVIAKDFDACVSMFYRAHPNSAIVDYEYYIISR
jgi:hypothetical protein